MHDATHLQSLDHPIFHKVFHQGKWTDPISQETQKVENPATEETIVCIPSVHVADVKRAIDAAYRTRYAWRHTPLTERIAIVRRARAIMTSFRDILTDLEIARLGCPVAYARAKHVRYQCSRIDMYCSIAETLPLTRSTAGATITHEPMGVVACITPWNYPLGQIIQKIVPALLMGNTVVLKPSSAAPLTAFYLVEAFAQAGLPAGVLEFVTGSDPRIGKTITHSPKVAMLSFTGSNAVGQKLASDAARHHQRTTMELGGKSADIWLEGLRDLDRATRKLFDSIFLNAGQTCTALSRLLIPACRKDRILATLLRIVPEYRVGDPFDPHAKLGPVVSASQFAHIRDYIVLGQQEGVTLLTGGIPEKIGKGYYITPTIFTEVTPTMRIAQEEIFGPVLCVMTYENIEQAIAIANSTPYGLSAAVSGPEKEALAIAQELEAGNVFINAAPRDLAAPFGGFKASGYGRESGIEGLLEFTQTKSIFHRHK